MEKGSKKNLILDVSLDLFSTQGYEATSTAQIAEAVGIRKASLYSHFSSKQDILDHLVVNLTRQYNSQSIFVRADWDDPSFTKDKLGMSPEDVAEMVRRQIHFIIHDPKISKLRKMLTIEQFQNEEMCKILTRQSYDDVRRYNEGLMRFLIRQGLLIDEDPEVMAAQFAWPVSMLTALCDREPEREAEAMDLMERHIRQFFRVYGK